MIRRITHREKRDMEGKGKKMINALFSKYN